MGEARLEPIGRVQRFFTQAGAAVVSLTGALRAGDRIYIKGHTTDFVQAVESMQVDHRPIQAAEAGATIGLRVTARCRKHDIVYRLIGGGSPS